MICVLVQEDHRFLRQLFSQLQDEATPEEKYRELVSCLHHSTLHPSITEFIHVYTHLPLCTRHVWYRYIVYLHSSLPLSLPPTIPLSHAGTLVARDLHLQFSSGGGGQSQMFQEALKLWVHVCCGRNAGLCQT